MTRTGPRCTLLAWESDPAGFPASIVIGTENCITADGVKTVHGDIEPSNGVTHAMGTLLVPGQ